MDQACHCPEHYPKWDNIDQNLNSHCVHRMSIASLFFMPLAYENYVARQAASIEQLELKEKWPGLVLTRTGFWGGEIIRLIESAESPSRHVQFLPPPFDVNVILHDGGIGTVQKAIREQQMRLVDVGHVPKELYLAHLTCPACEERKGGPKILVFRRWLASSRLQARIESRRK